MRQIAVTVLSLLLLGGSPLSAQDLDPALFSAMKVRSIGPAGMSGRIAAIDGLASDPNILWVGAATGGVWKSSNGGTTWTPVFDHERVSGIGAVAIDQNSPDVVWVGTGEGNPRNSAGVGAGLYKTMDGGDTWQFLGFGESERIHRIVLHPTNSDIAWIGVMGPAWSDGEERGVYKTIDGGQSFRRVLWVDERTGVSDLVIDPSNPMKLYAGMWEFRREPWALTSGGPGSGLFVSHDGGENWSRYGVEHGMPAGDLGRIGLSVAASDPDIVFALVEAEKSALLRTSDGGRTWTTVNDEADVANRPFYYTDIFVDPANELRVYNLNSRMWISEDGGRDFTQAPVDVHSDFHAMWIDPNDSRHLLVGTDGGVWESRDRAKTWRMFDNLPVGQFYHVTVDQAVPFNVYGGMQDNGSWRGPSDLWQVGGIPNHEWKEVSFGDGFNTMVDPLDANLGYGMSQGGRLVRFDLRTGERKFIRPWGPEGTPLRFNWNAPLAFDTYESGAMYYGSQFVHKSTDRGQTWAIVSPDLTTNDPEKQRQAVSGGLTVDATGAENHTTLMVIAPSPLEREVIWTGSDDGKVNLTRAGGGTWDDVTDRIGGVPNESWVADIEVSNQTPGGAYVVLDDHRRGNWETYLYRTDNYGKDWDNIGRRRGIDGFLHTVVEDPMTPNLLFAGGELGLFVSLDAGRQWHKWTHGLPTVPVRSLTIHPRDHDLVIGTHGRAIWILDDIRPLRALAENPTLAAEVLHLFDVPGAYVHYTAAADGYHFSGDAMFKGESRAEGAILSYWLADEVPEGVAVRISDPLGERVKILQAPGHRGLNRISWDLREDTPWGYEAGDFFGLSAPQVLPGTYSVTVSALGMDTGGPLEVLADPRVDVPMAERILRRDAILRGLELSYRLGRIEHAGNDVRDGVARIRDYLRDRTDTAAEEMRTAGGALVERWVEAIDLEGARAFRREMSGLSSSYDRPTEAQRLELQRLAEFTQRLEENTNIFLVDAVEGYRALLAAEGIDLFPAPAMVGN